MNKVILLASIVIFSCNTSTKELQQNPTEDIETTGFFPVTNYIEGQVAEIKTMAINPLKVTTTGKKIDSSWLKIENIDTLFKEFLQPLIDTINMRPYFEESTFGDQTLDAYTFTYTANANLPDSISLKRWDVHVDPSTNKVKRIFMIKKLTADKELQLTWQSDKWCKITCIAKDKTGNQFVEYEQMIKWSFD